MFERLTGAARAVVVDAQGQARRLGHRYIGCEHLLLALVSTESEVAAMLRARGVTPDRVEQVVSRLIGGSFFEGLDRDALASIGIDLDLVRRKVEAAFGPDAFERPTCRPGRLRRTLRRRGRPALARSGHLPFTRSAKKCLELSLREALAARSGQIGAEHIALALTSMGAGLAPRIFAGLGVSPAHLHTEIADLYRQAG
jgi:ATP-dependent Clp protease ATP-binding subunit ClpA